MPTRSPLHRLAMMFANILFTAALFIAMAIGLLYFRDLGDVSQMLLKVKRENMVRFIRNEYRLLSVGLGAIAIMAFTYLFLDAGTAWLFWVSLVILTILYGFPWVWVHIGLRNQRQSAKFYSIDEARQALSPDCGVLVIENNGIARAHPDSQLLRPHLAGNSEGLGDKNVIMTYCAMANLGIGYTPEIEATRLELEVLAQHANNLILRDNTTGEPIQQIYGFRECDGDNGSAMIPWPTFRMTFRTFQKAYPDGTVFLNKPSSNLLLNLFDLVMETIFAASIARQHNESKPVMDNMTHSDDRLPTKTYIWGINIGDDAVCFTRDFLVDQANRVNTRIGERDIVVAWDPVYESVGAWYNDSGKPVEQIDFFGNTDQGKLNRVETLKPGMFWHVWVEFFQHTDINRVVEVDQAA